jgi:AcrR family transcriptional regulator
VIEAASRLFAEHGYRRTSLDGIGEAVEVARPSACHHFNSKAEILHVVLRRKGQTAP